MHESSIAHFQLSKQNLSAVPDKVPLLLCLHLYSSLLLQLDLVHLLDRQGPVIFQLVKRPNGPSPSWMWKLYQSDTKLLALRWTNTSPERSSLGQQSKQRLHYSDQPYWDGAEFVSHRETNCSFKVVESCWLIQTWNLSPLRLQKHLRITWFGQWTLRYIFISVFHLHSTSWLNVGSPGRVYFSWDKEMELNAGSKVCYT